MRILIIGGNSSIGKALKITLSEEHDIVTAGRNNCDIYLDLNAPIYEIKFHDKFDTIILLAAQFGGITAEEILETLNINVLGTLKVCNAAIQSGSKHLILISSIFAAIEKDSQFYNIYSLSKKQAEEVADYYCLKNSLALTILRPSQVYGNDESFRNHQPFIYSIADKAERGEDIDINGSHDPLRNFLHIDDLCQIIIKVIQNKTLGIYPIMHTADLTFSKIAEAAVAAFNSKGNIHFLDHKENIPDNIFKHDYSLFEKIAYYPKISITEGMKKIAEYRSHNKKVA